MKDGEFRGGREHAHLVDVMAEVGKDLVCYNGRFGKGRMDDPNSISK